MLPVSAADNYWSMTLQPGSAFNRNSDPWHPSTLNSTHEPYNEMQSAISSYTTAQVAPSDGVGALPRIALSSLLWSFAVVFSAVLSRG